MKKRLSTITVLLTCTALAAINLFELGDKWRAKYPNAGEPGENPVAIAARSLVESPSSTGTIQVFDDDTNTFRDLTGADLAADHFVLTATITSAAAATAVNILPDSRVTAGRKVYLSGFHAEVNGATNWATTATVKIQDTEGTPVDFFTMAVAALTGNALVRPGTANITSEDAYKLGTGSTAGKGIQLKGNANGTGSDLTVTIYGVIK